MCTQTCYFGGGFIGPKLVVFRVDVPKRVLRPDRRTQYYYEVSNNDRFVPRTTRYEKYFIFKDDHTLVQLKFTTPTFTCVINRVIYLFICFFLQSNPCGNRPRPICWPCWWTAGGTRTPVWTTPTSCVSASVKERVSITMIKV